MTPRLTVIRPKQRSFLRLTRARARDGWRVFRSKRDGYEIAIAAYQVARVERFGSEDPDEWHALAVGELYEDDAGVHAVVRDFIPNDWADRGPSHVHVSPLAEFRVRELAAGLHRGSTPLGIIHTHPGYTTRYSATDRAEFWRDPHAVSIIVDPTDEPTIAVYRGSEGERLVERTADVSVSRGSDSQPMVTPVTHTRRSRSARQRRTRSRTAAVGLTLAASALAVIFALRVWTRLDRMQGNLFRATAAVHALEARLEAQVHPVPPPSPSTIPQSTESGAMCLDDSSSW